MRAVRAKAATVRKSVRGFEKKQRECEGVVVPRGRQEQVELLTDAGGLLAIFAPIQAELQGFATTLQGIQPDDAELVRGVTGWTKVVTLLGQIPPEANEACAEVLRWAANGYTAETAPVDFDALAATFRGLERHDRGIRRASIRLARLGVFPGTAAAFQPDGLIDLIEPLGS
jgi:hypothetical protein